MTTAAATEGLDIDAIVVWKLNRFSMSLEEPSNGGTSRRKEFNSSGNRTSPA